jgi:hypothetical protein
MSDPYLTDFAAELERLARDVRAHRLTSLRVTWTAGQPHEVHVESATPEATEARVAVNPKDPIDPG